ncbi:hypothetical protein AYO22_10599 [Fonsecaea multimorphosa]|nr:hypothetical protein AYO22_10599 [Fonsecaea multimorphosa]
MSQQAPVILVFSLGEGLQQAIFQDLYGRLMQKIEQKATVKEAWNTQEALDLINGDSKAEAIFVTETPALSPPETASCCAFSSTIRPSDLRGYFNKKWNLPWKQGSYHRTTVTLNQTAEKVPTGRVPSSYSQKAVFLADVDKTAAWYLPTNDSVTESHVFPAAPVPTSETPVACAKMGNGWLGYIGDVNAEEGTDDVVLAMLGVP